MQNGRIRLAQLSASSSWDVNHGPRNGRLKFHRTGSRMGAWCARRNDRYQYYQVDFRRAMRVVKIATQGRQDAAQWVTQYFVTYSQDGCSFAEYKENSNRKVELLMILHWLFISCSMVWFLASVFMKYFKHERPCLTMFPNAKKIVENTKRSGVFLTIVEVFGNVVKHCLKCLISSQAELKLKENGEMK